VSTRYWFVPKPDYAGPPVELVCGRHTKDGRFIPKNVKLSPGISRLSRMPRRRIPMVGDPSQDVRQIYTAHLAQKRRAGAPTADPLIGRSVALDTPCRHCGATAARIGPGKEPHAGVLLCSCGNFRKWISHESYAATKELLAEALAGFGEPASITLRSQPAPESKDR
jgi:hypothetical protein